MTDARLEGEAPAALRLTGELRAATVPGLLAGLPVSAAVHQLDLGGLGAIDSAGLALLLEWQRRLEAAGGALRIERAPDRLVRLARISGVDRLLGLQDNEPGMTEQ